MCVSLPHQHPLELRRKCVSLLMPLSLSTDIMVDMPDEQSIVTYVAQFLERFPELEPVRCSPSLQFTNWTSFPGTQGTVTTAGALAGAVSVYVADGNKVTSSCLLACPISISKPPVT
jgi:tetrahydromethanopterin S-methyltransferase subunit B